VAAWTVHPDLIQNEVGSIISEPDGHFTKHVLLLFLSSSEIIHSKKDTLQFRDVIRLLEVHDFSPQS
jgi:hypothetical protein